MTTAERSNIGVLGICLRNIFDGFGPFKSSASQILLRHGLGTPGPYKLAEIHPDGWYPLDRFLETLDFMGKQAGEEAVCGAGMAVPTNAAWPPHVSDLRTALESIDVAYHMNHGIEGVPMFDAASGVMIEGIGHYGIVRGPECFRCICESPYPCAFDRGLVTAIATQFEPTANVSHVPGSCRSAGGQSCAFDITWH